jgi:hypothetical protein
MTEATNSQLTSRRRSPDEGLITDQTNTCCGGPAPQGTNACCVRDADAKSTGAAGCGCGSTPAVPGKKTACCG